ncbi:hypothetical protein NQ318_020746 [Aromia moschata]|uniref:Uncharacterized protein n=1 Tax=Aromia moschata TaxID=1265417 RepID=A0AAV8YXX0_9CUCU|nr:hypothetical protein NQ318_020746 [Aromia moschata]
MNICADNIDTDPGLLDTLTLKGTRFESVEAVKAKATEVLNQLTEADFQHCFQQRKSRAEQCRDRHIEGEKVILITSCEILEVEEDISRVGKENTMRGVRRAETVH